MGGLAIRTDDKQLVKGKLFENGKLLVYVFPLEVTNDKVAGPG